MRAPRLATMCIALLTTRSTQRCALSSVQELERVKSRSGGAATRRMSGCAWLRSFASPPKPHTPSFEAGQMLASWVAAAARPNPPIRDVSPHSVKKIEGWHALHSRITVQPRGVVNKASGAAASVESGRLCNDEFLKRSMLSE